MNLEFVPVKGQKFDIGRTINPFKCDCEKCTFMNCPKHNYAVKMTRKKYDISVFWNEWKDRILEINKPKRWQYSFHNRYNFAMTYDMINDFFDFLCFNFPKGTYWQPTSPVGLSDNIGDDIYNSITLIKFSRAGREVNLGEITIHNHYVWDYDLSERQYKLAEKIAENLRWLKEKVFEYYREQDKDWKIGWLSPDGRHYPCSHVEHDRLARELGGEGYLESTGWIRVALEDEDGFFLCRHFATPEQRNWLSLNGYNTEDV